MQLAYSAGFTVWKRFGYNPASAVQGGIAQLGERLHGMQEVSGSIPLTSTTELTTKGTAEKHRSVVRTDHCPHRLEA